MCASWRRPTSTCRRASPKAASARTCSTAWPRFTVTAPPLRERPDDIPLLAEHFARAFAADMGREPPALTDETVTALRTYGFPGGNVRELKNVIERALLECGGGAVIEPGHLRFAGGQAAPVPGGDGASKAGPELPLHDLDEAIAETEKWVVARALAESGGNVSAATRRLGTNRNRMYRILGQKRDEADEGDAE
jgi:DNA-binding NtrC family response regulator